ncbi:MAG: DUF1772 domain-containing protein [Bacteroidetes bacterium]|nr:DUF1772 domain-containing protein [Bacteroidota bacterium]MBS1633542.1 DUF1772 domain-containing protein [Bacteroidota bacterium]
MKQASQLFMFLAIFCWAGIVGAVLYAHISPLRALLLYLPESSILENGPFPLKDELFWKMIHPVAIVFTVLALVTNWGNKNRRKYIAYAAGIYAVALIFTFTYFVPEIKEFANSNHNTSIPATEWHARGQRWYQLSWIRGVSMFIGFIFMLLALTKTDLSKQNKK